MRIFLDVTPWDIRSRNTDWRYVRYLLPRLAEWRPECDFYIQRSSLVTIRANYKTIRMAIGKRLGHPLGVLTWETDELDSEELEKSGANLVFSHRGFPVNVADRPIIWQSSILDPQMTASYCKFLKTERSQEEDDVRVEHFAKADAVQVSTIAEAKRLGKQFPALASRFVPIPFFLPYLSPTSPNSCERHICPPRVEILFVGNDARRKGLDILLASYCDLPEAIRRRTRLTIVSNFDRGQIPIPALPGIRVSKGLGQAQVLELMSNSHILVNLARFESYGFIFPEAMSHGVVCIGPDWEVQRELLDYGRAGINLPCDKDQLSSSLEQLIDDDGYRFSLAVAARKHYQQSLDPTIVASKYVDMFMQVSAG